MTTASHHGTHVPMCADVCRLGPLPLVCKRFQRLLLDPRDRQLWSELTITAFRTTEPEHRHQQFLAFLRSHLHQVEVAHLVQEELRVRSLFSSGITSR